ncbi:CU044_2847 family protein [Actinoplanes sp. M2I2]|uniref:CU044_2847 family protein n=1 Tax=Actinoplanes sp. M2I2 TaxID=1734444 RepID=UPI0020205DE1|nr:CU044_2847 family protein [Actinoplanes sp. M2I2]
MDSESTPQPVVRIRVLDPDDRDSRQISSRRNLTERLSDRRADIAAAVAEAVAALQESNAAAAAGTAEGWRVSSLEATFGIALVAEAGVILTKASTEASLEVTVTLERGNK